MVWNAIAFVAYNGSKEIVGGVDRCGIAGEIKPWCAYRGPRPKVEQDKCRRFRILQDAVRFVEWKYRHPLWWMPTKLTSQKVLPKGSATFAVRLPPECQKGGGNWRWEVRFSGSAPDPNMAIGIMETAYKALKEVGK